MRKTLGGALAAVAWLLAVGASAQTPDADAQDDPQWEVIVSPYLWATALKGEIGADAATVDVDASMGDILDALNLGAAGILEVRRDRWLFLFDFFWAELEDDVEKGPATLGFGPTTVTQTVRGPLVNPRQVQVAIPRVPVSVGPVEVDATTRQLILDARLGYRVLSRSFGELRGGDADDDPRRLDLDLFAGARYMRFETELEVFVPPIQVPGFNVGVSVPAFPNLDLPDVEVPGVTVGGLDRDFEENVDWVDLIVGLRTRVDLTERLWVGVRADLGGFGIGSASDFTWQAMGLLNYRLTDHWILSGGYRGLGYDREPYDLTQHGPILGFSYRF